jgi:succinate dehydrogenase / fumarate reductase cytochrome b subunit
MTSRRPVFLNLLRIRMPVGAWTSIGHRISGVILAASVPVAMWLLELSLRDASGYARARALLASPAGKAAAIIVAWSLAHHVLAGVRHLASDFQIGSSLAAARRSAWVANVGGAAIVAIVAVAVLL